MTDTTGDTEPQPPLPPSTIADPPDDQQRLADAARTGDVAYLNPARDVQNYGHRTH